MSLKLTDIQNHPDGGYYAKLNGRDVELSPTEQPHNLLCHECGRPEQYDDEGDCTRAIYATADDTFLCDQCIERFKAMDRK